MPSNKPHQIPALTGIRFLAALMIFIFHYADRFPFIGTNTQLYLRQLFLGVEVFFVLSGFIIAYTYLEQAELNFSFLKKYFVRRFARIYPLYLLLTITTFVVIFENFESRSDWFSQLLLNITLLKGFSSNYYLTGIEPTWSLTVEESFYLLAPWAFVLIKKKGILFWQVPVLWLIGFLLVLLFSRFPNYGFFSDRLFTSFVTFFGRCFEFYLGIWLALQYKRKISLFSGYKSKYPVLTLLGSIAMVAILFLLVEIQKMTGLSSPLSWEGVAVCNLVFPLAVILFLAGLLLEKSWLSIFLSSSLMGLLGRSSYAFFLIHTGIFAMAIQRYFGSNIFLLLVLLMAASIFFYLFFEKPINAFIRRKMTS